MLCCTLVRQPRTDSQIDQASVQHRGRLDTGHGCPSSLLSDEAIDPALQSQGHTDEFEKTLEMRRVAQDAFMKLSSREAAARALRARPRIQENYKSGDLVYVYRTLRRKKALRHGAAARSSPLKAKWVGPGQVLATEGSVVWINMLGELWRAAIEQVRAATSEEKLGIEVISEECEEMQETFETELTSCWIPRCDQ